MCTTFCNASRVTFLHFESKKIQLTTVSFSPSSSPSSIDNKVHQSTVRAFSPTHADIQFSFISSFWSIVTSVSLSFFLSLPLPSHLQFILVPRLWSFFLSVSSASIAFLLSFSRLTSLSFSLRCNLVICFRFASTITLRSPKFFRLAV